MRLFSGAIIEESLTDAAVLASLPVIAERVSNMPNDPDAKIWHVRWYRVEESELRKLLPVLAKAMRPHWYAHFWDGDDLCVILAGRIFWASVSDHASHAEFIMYSHTVGLDRTWLESIPTVLPDWVLQAINQ